MKYSVDNENYTVIVPSRRPQPDTTARAWATNHFVRHCVMKPYLGFHTLCALGDDQVSEYYAILHRSLLCPTLNNENASSPLCAACRFLDACFDKIKTGIAAYVDFLLRVVADDAKRPRHVCYDAQGSKKNIAFVSDNGVVVITQKRGRRLVVKTGFRPDPVIRPATSRFQAAVKSLPAQYFLSIAKKKFRDGERRGKYINVRYITPSNW